MNVLHYFETLTQRGQTTGSAIFYARESGYSVYVLQSALQVSGQRDTFKVQALTAQGHALLQQAKLPESPIALNYALASTEARLTKPSQFDVLRALLQLPLPDLDIPYFNGGLIGVFGYEMVRQLEALTESRADLLQDPDYLFFLPEHFVVVDHAAAHAFEVKLSVLAESCKFDVTKHTLEEHTPSPKAFAVQNWVSDTTQAEFIANVKLLQAEIAAGNIFQALSGRMLSADFQGEPFDLYCNLLSHSEAPYHFYLKDEKGTVIGASPECAVSVKRQHTGIETKTDTEPNTLQMRIEPIAGTRPRPLDPRLAERFQVGLQCDPKELAEHAMLIDLARNDIASVSAPGSVKVERAFALHIFPQIQHLVSSVSGTLSPRYDALHAYMTAMNMGTLTGAPKVAAMNLINQLEKNARGFFGGAFALLNRRGELDSSIIIRTARTQGTKIYLRAAAGIVADSIPEKEWEETEAKLAAPLAGMSAAAKTQIPDNALAEPQLIHTIQDKLANIKRAKRILMIDNEDSFVHNLAHEFALNDAEVKVYRNCLSLQEALSLIAEFKPDLLVFSPGPFHPRDARLCMELLQHAPQDLPIFGVCLGHQCIVEHFGGKVIRAPEVRHGKLSLIEHQNQGLFKDLPNPMYVARYHSLAGVELPAELRIDAVTSEGLVMAVAHTTRPIFGVQFHPESVLTPEGPLLIQNLMSTLSC